VETEITDELYRRREKNREGSDIAWSTQVKTSKFDVGTNVIKHRN
jgi:hypothetical protein